MMRITKEQEPWLAELKEIQKQMRQAAEQSKVYQNSMVILHRTIKKNELTIMQLEKVKQDRQIYVPLGRAFLQRNKSQTIKQMESANVKLQESMKEMEKNMKYYVEKANEKSVLLKQGSEKFMNAVKNNP